MKYEGHRDRVSIIRPLNFTGELLLPVVNLRVRATAYSTMKREGL